MSYKSITKALLGAILVALSLLSAPTAALAADSIPVYRMYNTQTSEHLYTKSEAEYSSCGSGNYRDWRQEGIGWFAPSSSSTPVYRLYNPGLGDHHYTASKGERDALIASNGWRDEGICWYSDDSHRVALYRVYNGRLQAGQHHYTTSAGERDSLVSNAGWRGEGVGWYGVKGGVPLPPQPSSGNPGSSANPGSGSPGSGSPSQSDIVLVTPTGTKYHRPGGCRSVNKPGVTTRQITLSEAQRQGYTPCANCYH